MTTRTVTANTPIQKATKINEEDDIDGTVPKFKRSTFMVRKNAADNNNSPDSKSGRSSPAEKELLAMIS